MSCNVPASASYTTSSPRWRLRWSRTRPRVYSTLSAGVPNIVTMTDAGDSPDDAEADNEPAERVERDRSFQQVRKFLSWARRTRIARRLPDRFLKPVDYLVNVIIQYQDHRNMLSGFRRSDWDEFTVSPTDHVRIPALFIVELFPPSVIRNLERANKRNRWASKQSRWIPGYMPKLDEARSGDAWSWWNLGEVARRGSGVTVGDATQGKMQCR